MVTCRNGELCIMRVYAPEQRHADNGGWGARVYGLFGAARKVSKCKRLRVHSGIYPFLSNMRNDGK